MSATAYRSENFEAPPVAYKKWGFQDHEIVNDCESIGMYKSYFIVCKDCINSLPSL